MILLWINMLMLHLLAPQLGSNSFDLEEKAKCKTDATVRDYTALDGCRFILELKDGKRLLPVELSDPEFLFSEGQLVKITYTEVKGAVTNCMTGSMAIKLECIQEIKPGEKKGQVFTKKECFDTQAPLSVAWINKVVLRNRVTEVKKGYFNNEPQYILYGNVNIMVFSCTGELLCEYPWNSTDTCTTPVEDLTELRSIWTQK